MSWGSLFTNLFSTNSAQHLVPSTGSPVSHDPPTAQYEHAKNTKVAGGRRNQQIYNMEEEEESRAPYWHCMLAGGVGGSSGDMLMHSIDTVKTRQQGDTRFPPRYSSLSSAYVKILRQEGLGRGLYSGVTPAFLGSFPGTIIFFGTYEWSKRTMIGMGAIPSLAYLTSGDIPAIENGYNHELIFIGFVADLAASVIYVPSEVLKTRLQLQGRYNNPFTTSGFNYRSTWDATRTIVRTEGLPALFYGYKATLARDLPFSALQFAFYEQERNWAKRYAKSDNIGMGLEVLTATTAGGLAGIITCPLDVVKTRIQTASNGAGPATAAQGAVKKSKPSQTWSPRSASMATTTSSAHVSHPRRLISTSSPSTTVPKHDLPTFDTSSVMTGLKLMYKSEGLAGCFRGVGPRFVWTSVQSGTMLVLYQVLLRKLATATVFGEKDDFP